MKRLLLSGFLSVCLLVSSFILAAAAEGTGEVGMDNENILYLGRWEALEDGSTVCGSYESGLELRFTGTTIAVRLAGKASSGFVYSLDGAPYQDMITGPGRFTIARDLAPGEHHLKLYSRFETARPQLAGFVLAAGASVLPVPETPKIEFIGDSITVGWIGRDFVRYGNLSSSYALKTGELLGFSHNTVAFGGIGLMPGGATDRLGMAARYFLTREYKEGEESPAWDTQRHIPDYVVVNLGTNDNGASSYFEAGYVSFLEDLRGCYPEAVLLAMAPFGGRYRQEIQNAVQARQTAGDDAVAFVDTKGWIDAATQTTDGVHLTMEAQELAADRLAAWIRAYIDNPSAPPGAEDSSADSPHSETIRSNPFTATTGAGPTSGGLPGWALPAFAIGGVLLLVGITTGILLILRRRGKEA